MIEAIADQPWLIVAVIGGLMLGYVLGFLRCGLASQKILKRSLKEAVYQGVVTTPQALQVVECWNEEARRPNRR